jgi:hypothetical protein
MISSMIVSVLRETKLLSKCIGFLGDNCNTNFGGVETAGCENVFHKLTLVNDKTVGVGCPLHAVHNVAHCRLNQLMINTDGTALAIHKHFSIFIVCVAKLREFCECAGTEYKMSLYHSKTRWPTLCPAVERILENFDALKSYFLTLDKPPVVLKEIFLNDMSKCYLWLIHTFMVIIKEHGKFCNRGISHFTKICRSLQGRI